MADVTGHIQEVEIQDTSFAVADGNPLGEGVLIQGDDGTDRKNINVDETTGDVQVDVTNTVATSGGDVVSTNNSSTATLANDAVFTGTGEDALGYSSIGVQVDASHDSATDGLTIEFSPDNTNWDDSTVFTYTAADGGRRLEFATLARYFRIVYTNGGSTQTHFRLQTILHVHTLVPVTRRLVDDVNPDTAVTINKSALMAQALGSGDFIAVQTNATGKLLVASDSDVTAWNGTTVDVNNGSVSAGTLRVTIADDSTGLVKLATGANVIGALTANQSVNVAQMNGVATTMDNGISGTGVQRVTLASDSTGQVKLATGSATIGALTANQTVAQATASSLNAQVVGNVASAATDSGNPVKVGAVFNTTQPTVSTGQRVNLQASSRGALRVVPGVENFATQAAQSGTWNINNVSGTISLPTGAATAANQSTGNTALQLIDDTIFADSAAFTLGTSKVSVAGAVRDNVIVDAQDTAADAVALKVNDQGALWTAEATIDSTDDVFFYADLDETEEDPSASPCEVYGFSCMNVDATPVYIQFFNTNTVTVGTTTPEFSIGVPSQGDANGAGIVNMFPRPIYFDTALSIAATTTATGAGGPGANEVSITVYARVIA